MEGWGWGEGGWWWWGGGGGGGGGSHHTHMKRGRVEGVRILSARNSSGSLAITEKGEVGGDGGRGRCSLASRHNRGSLFSRHSSDSLASRRVCVCGEGSLATRRRNALTPVDTEGCCTLGVQKVRLPLDKCGDVEGFNAGSHGRGFRIYYSK